MSRQVRLGGRLLVASPMLVGDTFRRTVILILDHGQGGALGLVVNRPSDIEVGVVLPAWREHATAPGRLFRGGPVEREAALGLVAVPGRGEEPAGVRRIVGSIGLLDLDARPSEVAGGLAGLRIFAGYAGWSAGQLEGEIEEGAWYVVDAEPRDAFTDTPQRLWFDVLRRQPGRLSMVSTYPDDPRLN